MPFNPTKNTFQQVANKQAYEMANSGNLNSKTMITEYDPIYNKLVQQISYTIYRKMRVVQRWRDLGANAPKNAYPGILREVYMAQRKGRNFAMDNGTRPTQLGCYDIVDDTIDTRYHAAQFRWSYPWTIYDEELRAYAGMDNGTRPTQLGCYDIVDDTIDTRYHAAQFRWSYPWTIYDEELRAYAGGNGTMIGELAEMKMINCTNARNMFMDSLRKNTLKNLVQNVAIHVKPTTNENPADFETLTAEGARSWLNFIDNIIFEMTTGSALYNVNKQYIQVPENDLVFVMPRYIYMNLIRRAYPDMFNSESYRDIFPGNLILIEYIQVPENDLVFVMPRYIYMNLIRRAYPDMFNSESYRDIFPGNLILIDELGGNMLTTDGSAVATPTFDSNGMNLLNWDTDSQWKDELSGVVGVIMHRDSMGFEDNLDTVLFGEKDIERLATPVRAHFWTKAYITDLLPCVALDINGAGG